MDSSVFSALYVAHAAGLEHYLVQIVRDRHAARDLVHDTLVKALERPGEVGGEAPGKAWLYRVAHNAALDHLRKSRRSTLEEPVVIDRRRESRNRPAEWGSAAAIHAEIEHLPRAQREVTLLRYRTGLTTAETAAALGKNATAVRQLELRALRTLRACLGTA